MSYRSITQIVLLVVLTCTTADAFVQQATKTSKRVEENVDTQTHLGMIAAEANALVMAEGIPFREAYRRIAARRG